MRIQEGRVLHVTKTANAEEIAECQIIDRDTTISPFQLEAPATSTSSKRSLRMYLAVWPAQSTYLLPYRC